MKVTETYLNNVKEIEKFLKAFSFSAESEERIRKYINNPIDFVNDDIKALFNKYDEDIVDYRIPLPLSMISRKEEIQRETVLILALIVNCLAEDDQFKFSINEDGAVNSDINISAATINNSFFSIKNDKRKIWKYLKTKYTDIAKNIYNKWADEKVSTLTNGEIRDIIDFSSNKLCGVYTFVSVMRSYVASLGTRKTSLKDKINTFLKNDMILDITNKSDSEIINLIRDKFVAPVLNIIQEIISAKTLDLDKFKLYLSFNVFDWLLASSGEEWHSCIDMNSNYCYGTGLLGMCGCPDWGMLLYTDGKEKNFEGIETCRLITRSWVCYTDRNDFRIINWYPKNARNSVDFSKGEDGLKFNVDSADNRVSKSNWDPITFVNGAVAWIYSDSYTFHTSADKRKIYFKFHDTSCVGLPSLKKLDNGLIVDDGSLSDEVIDGIRHRYTSIIDMVKKGGMIKNFAGSSEYHHCEICGTAVRNRNDMVYISSEDAYVCQHCFENNYFFDEHQEEYYRFEDGTEVHSGPEVWDYELVSESTINGWFESDSIFYDNFEELYYFVDCGLREVHTTSGEILNIATYNVNHYINLGQIFERDGVLYNYNN